VDERKDLIFDRFSRAWEQAFMEADVPTIKVLLNLFQPGLKLPALELRTINIRRGWKVIESVEEVKCSAGCIFADQICGGPVSNA